MKKTTFSSHEPSVPWLRRGERPQKLNDRLEDLEDEESFKEKILNQYSKMFSFWANDWKLVFTGKSLFSDMIAGVTVAAVALPLNLALAVAAGLPPQTGIIAGIVGGAVSSLFGGAALQVTGPAAALNVMVFAVAEKYGVSGVAAAALISGILQILLGLSLQGKVAKHIPEAVLIGFTTGVGLKLLDNQISELLGFSYRVADIAAMYHRPEWLKEVSWISAICGIIVALLVVSTKEMKKFPAALVGIITVTAISKYLPWEVERVGNIPKEFSSVLFPQLLSQQWIEIILLAIPLGLLSAAESLISAQAVDRMKKDNKQHEPNLELIGQGAANFMSALFQGMPVSGVIVRSSVNLQSGGKTRLSALLHALLLLVALLYFSESMSVIPLSALAGLLCVVGFRLIEFKSFIHLLKENKIEAIGFLFTTAAVVTGHLMSGLIVSILFIKFFEWVHKRSDKKQNKNSLRNDEIGIRAQILQTESTAEKPRIYGFQNLTETSKWITHLKSKPKISKSAYVHPEAVIIGDVTLSDQVHVAADTSIRADEGAPFYVGAETNVQDGVVLHALKDKWVKIDGKDWAIYIGKNVSLAHQALVHGPCFIGDHTFIGFKAVVHDSIIGKKCSVGIGATVVGVEIPDGKFVPHGMVIDSKEKVAALPESTHAHHHFNEDVVEVNRGLASAYKSVDEEDLSTLKEKLKQKEIFIQNKF